jgi:rhodanese-related sulfurtransferase
MEPPSIELVRAADWEAWSTANDAVIVDVREPHEWEQGSLPGAELIRLGMLPGHLDAFDRDRAILFICRTGNRSGLAARYFAMNGFTRAANLTGGLVELGLASPH